MAVRSSVEWLDAIKRSERAFRAWSRTSARIVDRYTLEMERTHMRDSAGGGSVTGGMNILWSNVNTLRPSLYSRQPKITAERRFKDQDPLGRIAAQVLERAVNEEAELAGLSATMNSVVLDVLLVGRGVPWVRYEQRRIPPVQLQDMGPDGLVDPKGRPVDPGTPGLTMTDKGPQIVSNGVEQKLFVDYVHWRDFFHSLDRNWAEVRRGGWVARRVAMTLAEGVERFGNKFKKAPLTLTSRAAEARGTEGGSEAPMYDGEGEPTAKYAAVYEVWDVRSKRRIHIADGLDKELEVVRDPYQLDEFFPCPRPAYATLSNEDLRPTQDYLQYEPLADELDRITRRIHAMVATLKVVGGYDASMEGLAEMMEAADGTMIGVKNFAKLMAAGGAKGVFQFWPIDTIAQALVGLYDARERTKQVLYEVSGISDVVRGQVDPREKATQSKIKANYAGQRLEQRRRAVEFCARDVGRMLVELMAELYEPQLLRQKSGFDFIPEVVQARQKWQEDYERQQAEYQQALEAAQQPPQETQGDPGAQGMPGGQEMAPAQPQPAPQPPPPQPPDPAEAMWTQVVQLVRDEKMRGFRIDVETDSTIELDAGDEMQKRTEMLQAAGSYMSNVLPIVQSAPQLTGVVGEMLLFTIRGMKSGRPLESKFEEAVEQMDRQAKEAAEQGPPPDPEAEAKAQKAQAETEVLKQRGQVEAQKAQIEGQKAQADMARSQMDAQSGSQKTQAEIGIAAQHAQLEAQKAAVEIEARRQELRHADEAHDAEMALKRQQLTHATEAAAQDEKKADADIEKSEAQAKNARRMGARPRNGGTSSGS